MNEELKKVIDLKLKKASAFINEANILLENKFYATVINRLYYGCFHATKALLLTKDLIPKTHSGVVTLLHKHFVQTNEFDMEKASFYSRLMQERIEEDYSDKIEEDADTASSLIEPAREYIDYIKLITEQFITGIK
jgi:uncharacterized protein (UPF0332 family)